MTPDAAARTAREITSEWWPKGKRSALAVFLEDRIAAALVEAVEQSWAPTCTETGTKAIGGACPVHGGDGCLMASQLVTVAREARASAIEEAARVADESASKWNRAFHAAGGDPEEAARDEARFLAAAIRRLAGPEEGRELMEHSDRCLIPGERVRFSKTLLELLLKDAVGDDVPEGSVMITGVFDGVISRGDGVAALSFVREGRG